MRSLQVYEQLTNHACRLHIDVPAGMKNGRNIIVTAVVRQNIERQKREATLNRCQNIDATFNRSTNNRTTNNRTISVKNDNDLTARQLLRIIEHSLTRPWLSINNHYS